MRRRYVVTGHLGSGTTTFARTHAQPGDLVWDWDDIGRALMPTTTPAHPVLDPPWIYDLLIRMREALVQAIESGVVDPPGIFIIATRSATASEIADRIHAEVITLGQ